MVLSVRVSRQSASARSQILDHQHVAEQVGRDLVVLSVVADELEHRPAHAVALRPGGRDRGRRRRAGDARRRRDVRTAAPTRAGVVNDLPARPLRPQRAPG